MFQKEKIRLTKKKKKKKFSERSLHEVLTPFPFMTIAARVAKVIGSVARKSVLGFVQLGAILTSKHLTLRTSTSKEPANMSW